MERFRQYEEEFLNCTRNLNKSMRALNSANGVVDNVISLSVDIELELSDSEGYIRAMDVEYRLLMGSDKKSASQKVSDYREEYKQLVQSYEISKAKAEKLALQNGSSARNKLISANQRLDQSTATLESSRILLAETEAIGNNIIVDLESQKESLKAANSNVQETKQYTVDAKGILTTMGRRAVIHNVIMILIIILLFAVICVIAYYGFVEKKKK